MLTVLKYGKQQLDDACNAVLLDAAVHERLLRTGEDFVWPVDTAFTGRFIIDVEFLDLKIYSVNVSCFVQLSLYNQRKYGYSIYVFHDFRGEMQTWS